jgi:hypothetical protein
MNDATSEKKPSALQLGGLDNPKAIRQDFI